MMDSIGYFGIQVNPNLDVELKPHAQPHLYQEKSLSKMFGNGKLKYFILPPLNVM